MQYISHHFGQVMKVRSPHITRFVSRAWIVTRSARSCLRHTYAGAQAPMIILILAVACATTTHGAVRACLSLLHATCFMWFRPQIVAAST